MVFCDEINLPDMDQYGTQRVISFLRQMVEHGGFYRTSDQTWIKLERIQVCGGPWRSRGGGCAALSDRVWPQLEALIGRAGVLVPRDR